MSGYTLFMMYRHYLNTFKAHNCSFNNFVLAPRGGMTQLPHWGNGVIPPRGAKLKFSKEASPVTFIHKTAQDTFLTRFQVSWDMPYAYQNLGHMGSNVGLRLVGPEIPTSKLLVGIVFCKRLYSFYDVQTLFKHF